MISCWPTIILLISSRRRRRSAVKEATCASTSRGVAAVAPGGTFFVVTAVYDEGESGPSNETSAGVEAGTILRVKISGPPPNQTCERCGNQVFRSFYDVTSPDEVVADFRETTERDLTTEAPATDVTRGDLYDLNNP